jgi:hypothetical protein
MLIVSAQDYRDPPGVSRSIDDIMAKVFSITRYRNVSAPVAQRHMQHCNSFARHCAFITLHEADFALRNVVVRSIRNPMITCRNPRLLALVHYATLAIMARWAGPSGKREKNLSC